MLTREGMLAKYREGFAIARHCLIEVLLALSFFAQKVDIGQAHLDFRIFDREGIGAIDGERPLIADDRAAQEQIALALRGHFVLLKDRSQSHVNASPLVRKILKAQGLHRGLIVRDSLIQVFLAISHLVNAICIAEMKIDRRCGKRRTGVIERIERSQVMGDGLLDVLCAIAIRAQSKSVSLVGMQSRPLIRKFLLSVDLESVLIAVNGTLETVRVACYAIVMISDN